MPKESSVAVIQAVRNKRLNQGLCSVGDSAGKDLTVGVVEVGSVRRRRLPLRGPTLWAGCQ